MSTDTKKGGLFLLRRYSGSARLNHWTTAITFVLLMLSGMALFNPSFFFLSALFGGGENMRWIHPWLGVILTVSFFGLFFRFAAANLPEKGDAKWLVSVRAIMSGHEEYLPEIGRYNAGQKVMFWMQGAMIPFLLISGLILWDQGRAFIETALGLHFSIEFQRWATLAHSIVAIGTILMWVLHVYAAIWVRGTISAMTKGTVTGGWGWRHHRKWLRAEVGSGKQVS